MVQQTFCTWCLLPQGSPGCTKCEFCGMELMCQSLQSWTLSCLAPSFAQSTVFVLLPGEVGALQVQGWMLSVLAVG